jgi:hypothetical protein
MQKKYNHTLFSDQQCLEFFCDFRAQFEEGRGDIHKGGPECPASIRFSLTSACPMTNPTTYLYMGHIFWLTGPQG